MFTNTERPVARPKSMRMGEAPDEWSVWLRYQKARVHVRLLALARAACAAIFWTVALITGTWLVHWELGWLARLLLIAWITVSLPAIMLQVAMLLDVMNYVVTRRILVLPYLHEVLGSESAQNNSPVGRITDWVAAIALVTSPLSGVATWSFHVLSDLPQSARIPLLNVNPTDRRRTARRRREQALQTRDDLRWSPLGLYWRVIEREDRCERPAIG
jgi:hypothetical protein